MKMVHSNLTRKITALLFVIMLSEQLASTGTVIYAHAEDATSAEYMIEHNVTSSWEGGYAAEIILTNKADVESEKWSVTFCTSDEIIDLWGGKITDCREMNESYFGEGLIEIIEKDIDEISETDDDIEKTEVISGDSVIEKKGEGLESPEDAFVEKSARDTEEDSDNEISDTLDSKFEEVKNGEVLEEDTEIEFAEIERNENEEETKHYFCYTIESLDYNAVIPTGGSVMIGYSAHGDGHAIWDEKALVVLKEAEEGGNTIPTGGTYTGDGYTVEVLIPTCWENAYNVRLRITNTSEETLHNWAFVMETTDSISGLYNAVELSDKDGIHLIKNAGYNQDITAGNTVEVGYTAYYGDKADVPMEFALSQIEKEVTTAECEVDLFITDEWEDGGLAQIVLTNISELPIEDWSLEFDGSFKIVEIWGGVIEDHEDKRYLIRNSGDAQNILPGESQIIGILFGGDVTDIRYVKVKQIVAEDIKSAEGILTISREHMTLDEDGNYVPDDNFNCFSGNLARVDEVTRFTMCVYDKNDIRIYETGIIPESQWEVQDIALIFGINKVVFEVCFGLEHYSETLVVDCKNVYNIEKMSLDLEDTDGDGLANYFEKYFGTDEEQMDTDNDGLTDYQELCEFWYDPLSVDTDNNGITDIYEDADDDGISNKEEMDMGSDPLSIDSDCDGLPDSIEINYGTSLILEDTDGDGISDYEEYILDKMNASYDKETGMYTVELSAEDIGITYDKAVVPSIKLTGDASSILNFSIEMIENNYLLSSDMIGYMGKAYELSTEGNMIGAELTFTYDESLIDANMLNSGNFYPAIYCYDPEDDSLKELENQIWDGNKITAHLEHFSTYLALNSYDVNEWWNRPIDTIESGGVSGSLLADLGKGKLTIRVKDKDGNAVPDADVFIYYMGTCAANVQGIIFWEAASPNTYFMKARTDRYGEADCYLPAKDGNNNGCYVVMVDKDNTCGYTEKIGWMRWPDGGFFDGIEAGDNCVLDVTIEPYSEGGKTKVVEFQIISKQPGVGTLDSCHISFYSGWDLAEFKEPVYQFTTPPKGVWHWEISGTPVSKGRYTVEIEKEGYPNKYMEIMVTENMLPFYTIIDEKDTFVKEGYEVEYDKNHDGLDDSLTKMICKGQITTSTGITAFASMRNDPDWETIYEEVMKNDDKDGDGLKNGEEIEIYYRDGRPFIKMYSNPNEEDSDGDDVKDDVDPHRLVSDIIEVNLPNKYSRDYLNVEGLNGGNQSWWGRFAVDDPGHKVWTALMKRMIYEKSEGYRIGTLGCGLIAMTNLEIYLTQQNDGYHMVNHDIEYDDVTGYISQYEYMKCANYNEDHVYHLDGDLIHYVVGVIPITDMENGIKKYLFENENSYNIVDWIDFPMKSSLITSIEKMISNNLPVVCSYHNPGNPIGYYSSFDDAKEDDISRKSLQHPDDHYMTIIGYIKYLKGDGKSYGYILKIESWGNIYYMNYDSYAKELNITTSILNIECVHSVDENSIIH